MSNKDIIEMILWVTTGFIAFGSSALFCIFYKLNKIYDELKKISKDCDYYDSCSLPEPNKKCKTNYSMLSGLSDIFIKALKCNNPYEYGDLIKEWNEEVEHINKISGGKWHG